MTSDCAICALMAENEQLREKVVVQTNASDAAAEAMGVMAEKLRDVRAENTRLRAVVNGTIHALDAVLADEQSDLRPPTSIILRTVVRHLRGLDISADIGGEP